MYSIITAKINSDTTINAQDTRSNVYKVHSVSTMCIRPYFPQALIPDLEYPTEITIGKASKIKCSHQQM